MHSTRYIDARLIYSSDGEVRYKPVIKNLTLIKVCTPENLRTVNAYRRWLEQIGVEYDIRLSPYGFLMVKSDLSRK